MDSSARTFNRNLSGPQSAAIVIVVVACFLFMSCRVEPVYAPERYDAQKWDNLPAGLEVLRYTVDTSAQISFYVRPAAGGQPMRLWMMFNGQGGKALDWPDMLANVDDKDAGFLLLDYPGFGFCQGSCTPARILAASEAAAEALRSKLGLTPEAFAGRLGVFGYSLGTATALQYAAKHPVRRIVVAAPFTTLAEIGDVFYFWPCGQLLRDRFDNIARLAEIAGQPHRPTLLIMHGDQDDTIPMAMSERLAAPYPTWVERIVVPGADHDSVVAYALRRLSVR
jgi:uncharacterized protein